MTTQRAHDVLLAGLANRRNGFLVGSGWLEHPTSAMSTLRSNQLS